MFSQITPSRGRARCTMEGCTPHSLDHNTTIQPREENKLTSRVCFVLLERGSKHRKLWTLQERRQALY